MFICLMIALVLRGHVPDLALRPTPRTQVDHPTADLHHTPHGKSPSLYSLKNIFNTLFSKLSGPVINVT